MGKAGTHNGCRRPGNEKISNQEFRPPATPGSRQVPPPEPSRTGMAAARASRPARAGPIRASGSGSSMSARSVCLRPERRLVPRRRASWVRARRRLSTVIVHPPANVITAVPVERSHRPFGMKFHLRNEWWFHRPGPADPGSRIPGEWLSVRPQRRIPGARPPLRIVGERHPDAGSGPHPGVHFGMRRQRVRQLHCFCDQRGPGPAMVSALTERT